MASCSFVSDGTEGTRQAADWVQVDANQTKFCRHCHKNDSDSMLLLEAMAAGFGLQRAQPPGRR